MHTAQGFLNLEMSILFYFEQSRVTHLHYIFYQDALFYLAFLKKRPLCFELIFQAEKLLTEKCDLIENPNIESLLFENAFIIVLRRRSGGKQTQL